MLNALQNPPSSLAAQILDAFPSGSYALTGLLRLLDVVETDSVPTAAVECQVQPRMLINPTFVAQHAATPEKLLMLVMHELHHVLLGHTTLFPRTNPLQNFVFDAVINGLVCRMFPGAAYTAFFSDYYNAHLFPQCLLRPAEGWPKRGILSTKALASFDKTQRQRIQEVHAALYSPGGASYAEVYQLLPVLLVQAGQGKSPGKSNKNNTSLEDVPLLGEHSQGDPEPGHLERSAPVLFDVVRELVEQWPQPPDPIKGRSLADVLAKSTVRPKAMLSNRSILRKLIRKVAGLDGQGRIRRLRWHTTPTISPIPNLSRRTAVLHALGVTPLLHPGYASAHIHVPSGERVHVYIDVSGSMDTVLKALYGAVLDCEALVFPTVHLFSSKVADISLAQLKAGQCQSTGGTDIGCVAEHMQKHGVQRALLVTDGWVGPPKGQHLQILAQSRLAVAYLGESINTNDLKSVANHTASLNTGVSS